MSVMCLACQALRPGQAGVSPHPNLGHQGFTTSAVSSRKDHREDYFRCIQCGAKWLRETDKWGIDLGFKLAP
jgi:hypothetical protein